MNQVIFVVYEEEISFLDLEGFLKDCTIDNLITRWCFTYHNDAVKPHYHFFLESSEEIIRAIANVLHAKALSFVQKKKECIKYTVLDYNGDLHPTLKSNFDVKAELKL